MSNISFLPKGVSVEENKKVLDCHICQADPLGPAFVVKVNQIPVKLYRKIFDKLNKGNQGGGFRTNQAQNDRVDKEYLKVSIDSWSGLTLKNWNSIIRDGNMLTGPEDAEIECSEEAKFYLYRNTFPSDFGDPVWETLKSGAEEQEEDDKDSK